MNTAAIVLLVGQLVALAPAAAAAPRAADAQVASQIFAFDMLVAAAQRAPAATADQAHRLAQNGMRVALRPLGLSDAEASLFWQAIERTGAATRNGADALFVATDVVTTEAHALMLSMVGPPPLFAPLPALSGLEPRQDKFAKQRIALSQLLGQVWREGHGGALWQALRPALNRAQPTAQDLRSYDRHLSEAFAGQQLASKQPLVLVAPLMAKDTGATLMQPDAPSILLLGPTATVAERDTLALHEMLHPRIAALIAGHPGLRAAIAASACLRAAYDRSAGAAELSQVYDGWADYLAESWVRGLSHQLGRTPQEPDGFPLAVALAALSANKGSADDLAASATALLAHDSARLCHL